MAIAQIIWKDFLKKQQHHSKPQTRRRWNGATLLSQEPDRFSVDMFIKFERYLRQQNWVPYGWSAKPKSVSINMFSRGISPRNYSTFPVDQSHWDAFYCSRDINVAMGYMGSDNVLNRIFVHKTKISNIWNTGNIHLGRNAASAMMTFAKWKTPPLTLFGLTGAQSNVNREPETAIFGSQIRQWVISVPTPAAVHLQIHNRTELYKVYDVRVRTWDSFERYLLLIN